MGGAGRVTSAFVLSMVPAQLTLHLGHLKGAKRDRSPWGSEQDPPASGLPAARASREAVLPSGIWEVSGFVLFPVTGSRLTAFM